MFLKICWKFSNVMTEKLQVGKVTKLLYVQISIGHGHFSSPFTDPRMAVVFYWQELWIG